MRRGVEEEVAAAARRRLEQLRAELGLDTADPSPADVGRGPGDRPHDIGPDGTGPGSIGPGGIGPGGIGPADAGRHLRRKVSVTQLVAGWVADRLPDALRGRVALGARELSLIVLVAIGGIAVAALVVIRSGGHEVSAAPLAAVSSAPSALLTPHASAGAGVASGSAAPAQKVVVDVAGRVRHPGVLRLPEGSRVVDAIRRAGGARHGVDLSGLNLARVLADGEQVLVGGGSTTASGSGGDSTTSAAGGAGSGPLVDINSASEEQLETLPGVGPVTAQKILAWRQAHGAFTSIDELLEVDGIGDKTLADLTPYVTL